MNEVSQAVKRGRPRLEVTVIQDTALDICATMEKQETDELDPAERLVAPATQLAHALITERDPWRRESYGEHLIGYLHQIHDYIVEADCDNHDCEACAYCLLKDSGGASVLTPEAMVRAELRTQRATVRVMGEMN